MGGTLGEVPLSGNSFGLPCVPGPHAEVLAAVGLGTVGLEVLAGSGRSSAYIPTPHARVALGTISLPTPGSSRRPPENWTVKDCPPALKGLA